MQRYCNGQLSGKMKNPIKEMRKLIESIEEDISDIPQAVKDLAAEITDGTSPQEALQMIADDYELNPALLRS